MKRPQIGNHVVHSHKSDLWGTPRNVFLRYHAQYQFTIDAAANGANHLLPLWWGPESPLAQDALAVSWRNHRCWLNPPYSRVKEFTAKAWNEMVANKVTTVMLVPSRTDTRWWHDYVWNETTHDWYPGVRGNFLKGRLKFTPEDVTMNVQSAPFPSVVIIFDGTQF